METKWTKTIWTIIVTFLIVFIIAAADCYAADTGNYLEVNREYKISNLEEDYISGYSFYLNVPSDGRIKVWIEGCNEVIYELVWIDNGDGSRSGRQLNVVGDRLDSGWISVTAGSKNMKLSTIDQGLWAQNETLYIEFEAANSVKGDIEDNDTLDAANNVTFGEKIDGNFSGITDDLPRTDIDCYVMETDEAGLIEISLINNDNPEYVIPFTLYAEDENGNYEEVLYVWDKNYLYLGYETIYAKTNFKVRVPNGRYYIKLEVDWKESSEYSLTVNFKKESADSYEQEWNNTSRTANRKDFGIKYTGNLHTEEDVDWYKFDIPEDGYITLNFWTPANVAEDKVQITLYDEDLKSLTSKKTTSEKYIKTAKKSVSAGTYYVRVKAINEGIDSEYDYKLRTTFRCKEHVYNVEVVEKADYGKAGLKVSTCEVCQYEKEEKIPALKLKKVTQKDVKKYNSTKVKVSWKDLKDEDGYQIYRMTKKNGSYSIAKKYTTSKSYINLKVKKGTTYYYKVRAYKDTENGRVYGSWSKIKSYKLQ